jgi:hypothetical protein
MTLHRDIHWIGRQWAVTGYGMQAIDRKVAGKFDVEMVRLWDDNLLESLREQKWFNAEDFSKGLAIARARFPHPPPTAAPPPEEIIPPAPESIPVEPPPEPVDPGEPEILKADPVEPAVGPLQPVPQEDLLEKWFNKNPMAARDPEPPRKVLPSLPEQPVLPVAANSPTDPPQKPVERAKHEIPKADAIKLDTIEPPKPAAPNFQMRLVGCRARFVRPWHVRIRRLKP